MRCTREGISVPGLRKECDVQDRMNSINGIVGDGLLTYL